MKMKQNIVVSTNLRVCVKIFGNLTLRIWMMVEKKFSPINNDALATKTVIFVAWYKILGTGM